jgi:hypothetical protein
MQVHQWMVYNDVFQTNASVGITFNVCEAERELRQLYHVQHDIVSLVIRVIIKYTWFNKVA